jgi:HAD superfamily hydrolase (TIGR01549 family)
MAPHPKTTIEIVFFDVGGVLYDDTVYARSWNRALREAGARFTDDEFEEEYTAARAAQSGSFRRRLMARFLPDGDLRTLERIAERSWQYPPSARYDDAAPCLERLRDRYRLGVIANQPGEVRAAMTRDGLSGFFEVWGISDELGVGKPDPTLFELAAKAAGVDPPAAVMVGDRLDYDVRPAKRVGMRAIWMLRGEAPDEPTAEQLAETDGAVRDLGELPAELERLASS